MYQSQFRGSNIYQSFPYNWHTVSCCLQIINEYIYFNISVM
ncbi:hypothetical protein WN943_016650 [Citrus x changshan-huyou]